MERRSARRVVEDANESEAFQEVRLDETGHTDEAPITSKLLGSAEDRLTALKIPTAVMYSFGVVMLLSSCVILVSLFYIMSTGRPFSPRDRPLPKPDPTMTIKLRMADLPDNFLNALQHPGRSADRLGHLRLLGQHHRGAVQPLARPGRLLSLCEEPQRQGKHRPRPRGHGKSGGGDGQEDAQDTLLLPALPVHALLPQSRFRRHSGQATFLRNMTDVKPYLPRGIWYDVMLGAPFHSAGEDFQMTPLNDTLCLLIRGGHVVPSQEPAQTTAASRLKPFNLLVAQNRDGLASGELYWDDGEYIGSYEKGEYSLVKFIAVKNTVSSMCVHCSYDTIMLLNAVTVYGVGEKPVDVRFNKQSTNFTYNPSGQFMKVSSLHYQLTKPFVLTWSR